MGSSDMNFSHFLLCYKTGNNPDSETARLQISDSYKELGRYSTLIFIKHLSLPMKFSKRARVQVAAQLLETSTNAFLYIKYQILDLIQSTDNYKALVNTALILIEKYGA